MPRRFLTLLDRVRGRIPVRVAGHVSFGVVVLYLAWVAWSTFRDPVHAGPSSLAQLVRISSIEGLATFLLVSVLLWLGRETPKDLGYQPERLGRQILMGLGSGLAILVVTGIALPSLFASYFPQSHGTGFEGLAPSPWNLPVMVLVGILGGGFIEELQRVFILTRFRNIWGRPGLLVGLVLEAGVFGLGHFYQGWGGVVTGALSGLLFALVWLRKGRIIEAMVAHACMDVVAFGLGALLGQGP